MPIYPNPYNILAWFKYNGWFLFIKIISLCVKYIPSKTLIETSGLLLGLSTMCLKFNQWNKIAKFAKHSQSILPVWLYIIRYFIQAGRDKVWSALYCEAPSRIKKYITVENEELIKEAIKKDKGVILVGAHYGPSLSTFMFWQRNIQALTLVSYGFLKRLQIALSSGIKPLISKRTLFYINSHCALAAKRSEKDFVQHLKKGGVVSLRIELRKDEPQGMVAKFFDYPVRFSYFPFKLALKYNAAVFFFFFNKVESGGYRLCLVPSGDFSTVQEAVFRYTSILQKQITAYPFMWKGIPIFWDYIQK